MNQREQFEKWYLKEFGGDHRNLNKDHEGNYQNYITLQLLRTWQAAQAAAVQWQPIETAPNDGKELVLLWVPAMGHGLMKWNGIWDDRTYNCDGPTHWMPLPPAPKPTEDV